MTRYIDPTPQYFDANGEVLSGGKLYFYDSGSATLKDIWYDSAKSKPAPNPITLYGDGRVPSVFLEGAYRVVLTESDGTQVWERDPVSSNLDAPFGADWSADVVYQLSDVVREDNKYWQSLTGNNFGNRPSTDGGINWLEVSFIAGTFGDLAFEDIAPVSMGGTGGTTAALGRQGLGFDDYGIISGKTFETIDANLKTVGFAEYLCDNSSVNTPTSYGILTVHHGWTGEIKQEWHPLFSSGGAQYRSFTSGAWTSWNPYLVRGTTTQIPDYAGTVKRIDFVPDYRTGRSGNMNFQDLGHVLQLTGDYTVQNLTSLNMAVVLINNSASSRQVIQGGGTTLRWLNGTGTTGTRTLAAWGRADLYQTAAGVWEITGNLT